MAGALQCSQAAMAVASSSHSAACQRATPQARSVPVSCRAPLARQSLLQQARRQESAVTCAAAAAELEIEADFSDADAGLKLGADLWNSTYYPTAADAAKEAKNWYIIDAEGQTLGRLASLAAMHVRGKNLPTYTPSMDMGGYVVVINAEKVAVTGRKFDDKLYHRFVNGRPGGMKTETFKQLQARIPERIVEKSVKGMLPKGRLGDALFHHLKVYKGAKHPHEAQRPKDITGQISRKPAEVAAASQAASS